MDKDNWNEFGKYRVCAPRGCDPLSIVLVMGMRHTTVGVGVGVGVEVGGRYLFFSSALRHRNEEQNREKHLATSSAKQAILA